MRLLPASLLVLSVAACGADPVDPPAPTRLAVTVLAAESRAPLAGAEVVVLTDGRPSDAVQTGADGLATIDVVPGTKGLRVVATARISAPRAADLDLGVLVPPNVTTAYELLLEARPGAIAGGALEGVVRQGGVAVPNALVVASATSEQSALSDASGRYAFLDLPAGVYRVMARVRGRPTAQITGVQISVGATTDGADLELSAGSPATVSGTLGAGTGQTRVWLTHAGTNTFVPDLSVLVDYGAAWMIDGVPEGTYLVRAGLEHDGRTLDADVVRSGALPLIDVPATGMATVDLATAPAIDGATVTQTATSAEFSWSTVVDADYYVVEVRDAAGQLLWGGFDSRRRPTMRVLAPATRVAFGELATPIAALEPGRLYGYRIYAAKDVNTGQLFEIIAASEELAGEFRVSR